MWKQLKFTESSIEKISKTDIMEIWTGVKMLA